MNGNITTNTLSEDAKSLSDFTNKCLDLLAGQCQEPEEVQDYYLGILRKHSILLHDLSLILKNRKPEYISTPFIILRSLIDDFLHVLFLEQQDDKELQITKINAEAYRNSFLALQDITESNHRYFEGKKQNYITYNDFNDVKKIFVSQKEKQKYFTDLDSFKFHRFFSFSEMVRKTTHSSQVDAFKDRAFYLWKTFSSFVHYSNYSFEYELQYMDENLAMIDEAFQYCYNAIYLSFKHFESQSGHKFIFNAELMKKYGIILK